jgi:hypothetical protein
MNSGTKLLSIMMKAQAVQQSCNSGTIIVRAVHSTFYRARLTCRITLWVKLKLGAESNTMISKDEKQVQGTESTQNNTRTDGIQVVAAHTKAPRGRHITQSKNGVSAPGNTWHA